MKKVLLTATVQSHIAQFHLPLIEMLKNNGFEVHVAARDNLEEKNGLVLNTPDKIYDVPFDRSPFKRKNIRAYKELKGIFELNDYSYIHCNTPMGGVITRLAAKKNRNKGTKVIYTAHGFHFYKDAPRRNWLLYYPIEKYLANFTDKLITITREDYELARRYFSSNIYHVHGVGANQKKYFKYSEETIKKLKQELGYHNNNLLILCIGELNSNKNQKTIIKAINQVKDKVPGVKLLLAGNGPSCKDLENLVASLNLNNYVEFLGYKSNLDQYINISQIIISASYREGLPLNIMEAMLCEKPVIASINRGHLELVDDELTGYLVSPDDSNTIADRILKLFEDSDMANKMGQNGRKKVTVFTRESVTEEIKEVYNFK